MKSKITAVCSSESIMCKRYLFTQKRPRERERESIWCFTPIPPLQLSQGIERQRRRHRETETEKESARERERNLSASHCHTCRAQLRRRTMRSNCWCSSMALLACTWWLSSWVRAKRDTRLFSVRSTAGNICTSQKDGSGQSPVRYSNKRSTHVKNTHISSWTAGYVDAVAPTIN